MPSWSMAEPSPIARCSPTTSSSPRRTSNGGKTVLLQHTLAPYRVSLFNRLSNALDDRFLLFLEQKHRPLGRSWTIPWAEVAFEYVVLDRRHIRLAGRTFPLPSGVTDELDRADPAAIVLGGWNLASSWVAIAWARERSIPLLAWVESSQRTGSRRGRASNAVRRRFLSSCDAAIVSGLAAEEWVRSFAPQLPCDHVPNSVDSPELRELAPPPNGGAALFLGELSVRKGADILLSSAEQLLSIFPRVLIAGDGPLRNEFVAKSDQLSRFDYVGFVEGAARAECMRQAAVVLLPSRRDPWPLAACEALVSRRPLVAGQGVGSVPDLRALAGSAVVSMRSQDAAGLVQAAHFAKVERVQEHLRYAFSPDTSALKMARSIHTRSHRELLGSSDTA